VAGLGLEIQGLDDLMSRADAKYLIGTPLNHLMRKAGAALRQAAQREAPKGRTKKLSRSHVEVYGQGTPPAFVRIENTDQPKATFVALGTRPHRITARNAKALFWPGARHPVKSVFHPGTKPNDWLGRAQIAGNAEITGPIQAAFDAEVLSRWEKHAG
jgi:hypothetical protein